MSRKLNSVSALLVLTLMAFAATSAIAQIDRAKPGLGNVIVKGPTLACCRCLGTSTALDLSTISSNNWTVTNNGNTTAAVPMPLTTSAWNINPGPAQWVSTSATGGNGAAGDFDYKLNFVVPACAIRQSIALAGSYGGDNTVSVYLDTVSAGNLISQCTGIWCFSSSHQPLPTFTKPVSPGPHTLIVRVNNAGGPTGMFINARLTGQCPD